ncbi:nuclear pore complex subunit [Mycoemilia scoparia]|uniref:Nuclear pore protein n=1 Tax=Mycoemilia scoparia TaxID=417184 RepID=A0A9W8DT56_9FUNG|nr:nuclear pore complex subunit [Mycoemilia scoparia]
MSTSNTLGGLLESSRKLTSNLTGFEIPTIERDLELLESASRKLVTKAARVGIEQDTRILLAKSGLNADQLKEDLENISLAPLFEFNQPQHDPDVELFLSHQQEQTVIGAIDDSRHMTLTDFDRYISNDIQRLWDEKQVQIFDELGQHRPSDINSLNGSALDQTMRSSFMSPVSVHQKTAFDNASANGLHSRPRALRYAKAVETLNKDRLNDQPSSPTSLFRKVIEDSFDEIRSKQIKENWNLLELLVLSAKDGHSNSEITKVLISGSRQFLEESFVDYIDKIIAQRPYEAALGGNPSIHNKIRAFLKLKFSLSKDNPEYLEAKALKYAKATEDALANSDPHFITYLKKYADSEDHMLMPSDRDRLLSSFNIMKANPDSIDPYKFAIYKILGRCELQKKSTPHVIRTTEDYLWLQLMLVRELESATTAPGDRYSLKDLQKLLLKFGPKHFDPAGNNPLLYFRVLLLSLQFEQAINYLVKSEIYQIEAVHFAIALSYYGYIQKTSPEFTTQYPEYVTVEDGKTCLDYAKLIVHYIRTLPDNTIEHAIQYLLTISAGGASEFQYQIQLCQSSIIRILFESREYAYFLGDILKDGARKKGVLERYYKLLGFKSSSEFTLGITKHLANMSQKEGRLPDSVLLYNLAGEYNAVLRVMIKQLGDVLYTRNNKISITSKIVDDNDPSKNSEDVIHIAHAVLNHYEAQDHIYNSVDKSAISTCSLILNLISFTEAYREEKHELALSIIQSTGLIPLDDDINETTRKSEQIRNLDPTIIRNFPDILLLTMDVLSRLYSGLKESSYPDSTKQANMDKLRRSAHGLMVFAGMIQFRMPPDTFARLNRIDAFMN